MNQRELIQQTRALVTALNTNVRMLDELGTQTDFDAFISPLGVPQLNVWFSGGTTEHYVLEEEQSDGATPESE